MIPAKVKEVLDAHGLAAVEFEPGSCATSELAASRFGVPVSRIAKSLLFACKDGAFVLVVCPGDRKISSSKLKAAAGKKSRMATPEEALRITGFSPGGVCPFGIDGSVRVFMDSSLAAFPQIFPAAGTDSSGVPMTYAKLVEITGAVEGDLLSDGGAE